MPPKKKKQVVEPSFDDDDLANLASFELDEQLFEAIQINEDDENDVKVNNSNFQSTPWPSENGHHFQIADRNDSAMSVNSEYLPQMQDYNENVDYARLMRASTIKRHESDILSGQGKDQKVGINLKGLKQLLTKKGKKEQFEHMISFIRSNRCEVVIAQETPKEAINLKQTEDSNKLEKVQAGRLKIDDQSVIQAEVKVEEGTPNQKMEPTFIYFRSQQMLSNFNSYGQCLYYQELISQECEDIRLATLCKQSKIRIGIIYGFTLQMKTVTFGVYVMIATTPHFQQNHAYFLMSCLLQVTTGRNVRHYRNITFFAHSFKDIASLSSLCKPYQQQMKRIKPMSKVPSFSFLLDPIYLNYSELLGSQMMPFKQQLQDCMNKLLTTDCNKQFGMAQTKLFLLLTEDEVAQYRMANGYTVRQFVEIFMQQSQYICLSQTESLLGVCEYYFRKHPSHRQPLLNNRRQQVVDHCVEVYLQLCKQHEQSMISQNVLLYLGLGVIDRLVQSELEEHKRIVNEHYSQLGKNNYRLIEEQVPQLKFIKLQTSKYIYQYLVDALSQCYQWQASNHHIIQAITYFNLEIEHQDELYYQQYKPLPIRLHNIHHNNPAEYYELRGEGIHWACECAHRQRFGLPCCHELKVCLLTNSLIMGQMEEAYIDEEYYDKYVQEEEKLQAKIESMRKKEEYLEPMGTQPGRNALINHTINTRKYSKGSLY